MRRDDAIEVHEVLEYGYRDVSVVDDCDRFNVCNAGCLENQESTFSVSIVLGREQSMTQKCGCFIEQVG